MGINGTKPNDGKLAIDGIKKMSLAEKVRLIRLDLIESDMSISDILELFEVGQRSAFYREFKNVFGMSPNAYRKTMRSKSETKPQSEESGDSTMTTVSAGQTVELKSNGNGWVPHSGSIKLAPHEKLVAVKAVDLTISSEDVPEQTVTIDVDHIFSPDKPMVTTENDVEITGLGKCTIVGDIRVSGLIHVYIKRPDLAGYIACRMSAMVRMSIGFEKPTEQQPYEPGVARFRSVLNTGDRYKPENPWDRVVYYVVVDKMRFVVGLDEDLRNRPEYDRLDEVLSDIWVKCNLADLPSFEVGELKGDTTVRMSLERAISSQPTLEEIVRATYGVPVIVATIAGVGYILPLAGRDGAVLPSTKVGALNMKYWNNVQSLLPTELNAADVDSETDLRVVTIDQALSLQLDWDTLNRN